MRTVSIAGLLCLCLVLASACGYCADTAAKAAEPAPSKLASDPPLTRIDSVNVYGAVVGGDGALQDGSTFQVNDIYSLQIRVVWRRIPDGLHVLQLKFTTPEGTVYETNATPFVVRTRGRQSAAMAQPTTAQLKDVVHPIAAQISRDVPGGGQEVWAELLMAGTWAQRLPGDWKMEVLLDGVPTVYDTRHFTLQAGGAGH